MHVMGRRMLCLILSIGFNRRFGMEDMQSWYLLTLQSILQVTLDQLVEPGL